MLNSRPSVWGRQANYLIVQVPDAGLLLQDEGSRSHNRRDIALAQHYLLATGDEERRYELLCQALPHRRCRRACSLVVGFIFLTIRWATARSCIDQMSSYLERRSVFTQVIPPPATNHVIPSDFILATSPHQNLEPSHIFHNFLLTPQHHLHFTVVNTSLHRYAMYG